MSNLSYLHDHKPFDTTHELNSAVDEHFSRNKYSLNDTDRNVMLMLSQYAVKYHGVAHLKVATIAKSIKKSGITVRRSLNKLVRLSVIEKRPFMRKVSGGNGANLFVFLSPSDEALSPNDNAEMITREDVAEATPIKDDENNNENEPILHSKLDLSASTYLTTSYSKPYERFTEAINTFVGSTTKSSQLLRYKLYGIYLAEIKQLRNAYELDVLIEFGVKAIHATFHASKRQHLRSVLAYYSGVLRKLLDREHDRVVFEMLDNHA